jgi:hypothetical protein
MHAKGQGAITVQTASSRSALPHIEHFTARYEAAHLFSQAPWAFGNSDLLRAKRSDPDDSQGGTDIGQPAKTVLDRERSSNCLNTRRALLNQ